MKRGKRRIQKVWILLNTTELKQTKHNPTNSPINSKLTKLMREKVSRDERSRELQKKENPCKIQSKKKRLKLAHSHGHILPQKQHSKRQAHE